MNYDEFLERKRAEHYDVPDYFNECVYCNGAFDPDDMKSYEDVATALDRFVENEDVVTVLLAQVMPEDARMCPDCVDELVKDYARGNEKAPAFRCRMCGEGFEAPRYIDKNTRSVSPCCRGWFDRLK